MVMTWLARVQPEYRAAGRGWPASGPPSVCRSRLERGIREGQAGAEAVSRYQ